MAFVPNFAPLSSPDGVVDMEQHGMPLIGGDLINLKSCGRSHLYYPQSYLESVAGGRLAGRWAVEIGRRRVVVASLSADESVDEELRGGDARPGRPAVRVRPDVSLAETVVEDMGQLYGSERMPASASQR